MGKRNYLIDGISGTGKTTVANELQRRGYHVLHGDRVLAYIGDPQTGDSVDEPDQMSDIDKAIWMHAHHIWDVGKVKSGIADNSTEISFFCGVSRNFEQFIDLFDGVFILEVKDISLIFSRLDERVAQDPSDWGGKPEEKELVAISHEKKSDIPQHGVIIDASAPIKHVVDEILSKCW